MLFHIFVRKVKIANLIAHHIYPLRQAALFPSFAALQPKAICGQLSIHFSLRLLPLP
jgi:hypothetical protein